MGDDGTFADLLSAMPKIAAAINHFESESVQQDAFRALISAWSGPDGVETPKKAKEPKKKAAKKKTAQSGSEASPRKTRSGKKKTPSLVKDLNLRPPGLTSFRDFVAEKKPSNNHDRNVISVYYLEKIMELDTISVDHVFTAYREASWRIPSDVANSVALTAHRKGWIDSSNTEDLCVTAQGLNHVEQDMASTVT